MPPPHAERTERSVFTHLPLVALRGQNCHDCRQKHAEDSHVPEEIRLENIGVGRDADKVFVVNRQQGFALGTLFGKGRDRCSVHNFRAVIALLQLSEDEAVIVFVALAVCAVVPQVVFIENLPCMHAPAGDLVPCDADAEIVADEVAVVIIIEDLITGLRPRLIGDFVFFGVGEILHGEMVILIVIRHDLRTPRRFHVQEHQHQCRDCGHRNQHG